MLRKERKWSHIKYSVKTTKCRKRVQDKNRNEEQGQQIENSNISGRYKSNISIIILNISGLNASIERQSLSEWIEKQYPTVFCLQETHFKYKDTCRLKVNGLGNIIHANNNKKKAGVVILIWDTANFRARKVLKDKE